MNVPLFAPLLLAFTLVFAIVLHTVGTLMSSAANNAVDSTPLEMMVALLSFVLSGYTWPALYMPGFLIGLARIFPSTWAAAGIRLLSLKDAGLAAMLPTFIFFALTSMLAAGLVLNFAKNRKPLVEAKSSVNCGYSYPRKLNRIKLLRQQIQAR